jgi:hypothetical protein
MAGLDPGDLIWRRRARRLVEHDDPVSYCILSRRQFVRYDCSDSRLVEPRGAMDTRPSPAHRPAAKSTTDTKSVAHH